MGGVCPLRVRRVRCWLLQSLLADCFLSLGVGANGTMLLRRQGQAYVRNDASVLQPQLWHIHVAVSPSAGLPDPPHGNRPATLERAPLRAPRVNEALADAQ
jgi:hypothetical protein